MSYERDAAKRKRRLLQASGADSRILREAAADDDLKTARDLTERIKPMFAGQSPAAVGAVLADLLAIWLAGHHDNAGKKATAVLRADLLAMHLGIVSKLVEANEQESP